MKKFGTTLLSLLSIAILIYLLLFIGFEQIQSAIPQALLNVNTIFLSIVLEALPFIFLGVFASALIQTFVSEETVQKWIPKNPIGAIVPAVVVSAIFPVCECAIIPVVRRLLKKGMPLHIGVIFIVGAPLLNPIVFASTYYAFHSSPMIAFTRMGMAFVLSIIIGSLIYMVYRIRNQLKWTTDELLIKAVEFNNRNITKMKLVFFHASDDFSTWGSF